MRTFSRRQFTKLAAAGGICAAVGVLSGCFGATNTKSSDSSENTDNNRSSAEETSSSDMSTSDALSGSNLLIAYFSCTGTTEQIAK